MEESEEQNEQLPQDQRVLRQQRFFKISEDLDSLGISLEHAADVIRRHGGHLRNAKAGKVILGVKTLELLELYVKYEKDIRDYFKAVKRAEDKNKGVDVDVDEGEGEDESKEVSFPQINEKNLKYNTLQEEILTVAEKNFAYTKAFIEYQVEKDVKGNKELKKERLDNIDQAAANHLATSHLHKNSLNRPYPKTSKEPPPEDNLQPPALPKEPTL